MQLARVVLSQLFGLLATKFLVVVRVNVRNFYLRNHPDWSAFESKQAEKFNFLTPWEFGKDPYG